MRLGEAGEETIAEALKAGITLFDTARAYPGNEELLSGALRRAGAVDARIVTKGGMTRLGGAWVADGRAKAIRADCEASLEALDGLPIDLYLLHAPDPRRPWATSVRALSRLVDDGLVRAVGISNVNRGQLDEALELAPIAAVQVGLSILDDTALRGGVVERCAEAGIELIAHSPLGGPRRAPRLARHEGLAAIAAARGATPAEVALAWLLDLSPVVVPIPGATRPETARSAAHAATLRLTDEERAALGTRRPSRRRPAAEGEVVLVMGIPGAGKSRVAEAYVSRGYSRLNRDDRGGTLRELAETLDDQLASGAGRVVLDNTYLTRASRSHVLDAAARHGGQTRCVWLDTPLAQAQVNMVERLLDRLGALPSPEELRRLSREPGILTPTSQMRTLRELEPPAEDEGFASIERVAFERAPRAGRAGVFVAAAALAGFEAVDPGAPHLVFDWRPDGSVPDIPRLEAEIVETAVCPHPGGAPTCWCRPPLPGLLLAFARTRDVDPASSLLVGTSAAHRTLANVLGARYVEA